MTLSLLYFLATISFLSTCSLTDSETVPFSELFFIETALRQWLLEEQQEALDQVMLEEEKVTISYLPYNWELNK
tara:strand:- start:1346 stop:1567 length:222 start_codon:yes stop_codon:yes gene_type:complete